MSQSYSGKIFLKLIILLIIFQNIQAAERTGLEIMAEVVERDSGFGDSIVDLTMMLFNHRGDKSIRQIKFKTLEMQDDGDKSLSVFNSPKDIKGTAFLSFTHALEADEQWLYLPAIKRVKRISSSNKSGPFLGSEFAFEDLTSFELEKFSYQYLRDETINGIDSFVIEMYPQYKHSGYTRQIMWVDKQRYIPVKVTYYDRKDALLKTLTYKKYQQYLEQYWRSDEMEMENHQNGKKTLLHWNKYQFKVGLSDRDFDRNSLKRSR